MVPFMPMVMSLTIQDYEEWCGWNDPRMTIAVAGMVGGMMGCVVTPIPLGRR